MTHYYLRGVARTIPDVCTFVTPVFADNAEKLFFQEISEGCIRRFVPADVGAEYAPIDGNLKVSTDTPAIYAFELTTDVFIVGNAPGVTAALHEKISAVEDRGGLEKGGATLGAIRRFLADMQSLWANRLPPAQLSEVHVPSVVQKNVQLANVREMVPTSSERRKSPSKSRRLIAKSKSKSKDPKPRTKSTKPTPNKQRSIFRERESHITESGTYQNRRTVTHSGASWSAAELRTLKQLAKTASTSAVAKQLGRSPAAVQQKAARAGISFRAAASPRFRAAKKK